MTKASSSLLESHYLALYTEIDERMYLPEVSVGGELSAWEGNRMPEVELTILEHKMTRKLNYLLVILVISGENRKLN